jgi:hypothetical protein
VAGTLARAAADPGATARGVKARGAIDLRVAPGGTARGVTAPEATDLRVAPVVARPAATTARRETTAGRAGIRVPPPTTAALRIAETPARGMTSTRGWWWRIEGGGDVGTGPATGCDSSGVKTHRLQARDVARSAATTDLGRSREQVDELLSRGLVTRLGPLAQLLQRIHDVGHGALGAHDRMSMERARRRTTVRWIVCEETVPILDDSRDKRLWVSFHQRAHSRHEPSDRLRCLRRQLVYLSRDLSIRGIVDVL